MRLNLTKLCATALAAAMAASIALPASAAPIAVPRAPAPEANVLQVQSDADWRVQRDRAERREWRRDNDRREWRRDRDRREWRRADRRDRDDRRFSRRGDNYYFNGHRGFRDHRPGYREHNGWWFPAAAFIAGAVITGAIQNQGNVVRGGNAHVQWCYDRYRSYRASDNTFQPYNGPRQQCYSPY